MDANQTFLSLEILDFEKKLLINKLKLGISNQTLIVTSKSLKIKIKNFPKNIDDYYIEKIELISDDKIKRYFRLKIIKNKENYYQIFLNELNNYAFNIGYFNPNSKEIPNQLEVTIKEKNYKLKEICSTDLPFIKVFGIINCDKTILINKKQEILLEEDKKGSFEINFIATDKDYSIKIIKIYKNYYPILKINEDLKNNLDSIIKKVKNKLNDTNVNKSEFSIYLTEKISLWKKLYLDDYKYFVSNKLYPLDDYEYSLLLKYIIYLIILKVNKHTESYPILKGFFSLLSIFEEKKSKKIITEADILSFAYYYYMHYCSAEKYKDCLYHKNESYKELYDNSLSNWLDFEIIFIKECKNKCSYYKAIELLKNVVNNLDINSKLIEILYLSDSGVGKIRKNKNKNKKWDFSTSFNLSLTSKENIISHVKCIIPNIIIRKDRANTKQESYAECDIYSGLMTIYEYTIFKKELSETRKFLIESDDIDDKYTITIFLCLLHEICSYLNLVLKNSPNVIHDPYNKYKELGLERNESGRTLEYYISKDINKIKFLKFSFSPKSKLNNYKLWIDKDFSQINLIIDDLILNSSNDYYLQYALSYFPTNVEKEKNDKNNENKNNEENENIWEFSSPAVSEAEEDIKENKSYNKRKINDENEFGESDNYIDKKPIVKY